MNLESEENNIIIDGVNFGTDKVSIQPGSKVESTYEDDFQFDKGAAIAKAIMGESIVENEKQVTRKPGNKVIELLKINRQNDDTKTVYSRSNSYIQDKIMSNSFKVEALESADLLGKKTIKGAVEEYKILLYDIEIREHVNEFKYEINTAKQPTNLESLQSKITRLRLEHESASQEEKQKIINELADLNTKILAFEESFSNGISVVDAYKKLLIDSMIQGRVDEFSKELESEKKYKGPAKYARKLELQNLELSTLSKRGALKYMNRELKHVSGSIDKRRPVSDSFVYVQPDVTKAS